MSIDASFQSEFGAEGKDPIQEGFAAARENVKDNIISDIFYVFDALKEYFLGENKTGEKSRDFKEFKQKLIDRIGESAAVRFVESFITVSVDVAIDNNDSIEAEKLKEKSFGRQLLETGKKAAAAVIRLIKGEVTLEGFIELLGKSGFSATIGDILSLFHIKPDLEHIEIIEKIVGNGDAIKYARAGLDKFCGMFGKDGAAASSTAGKFNPCVGAVILSISVACLTAAFKMTQKYISEAIEERQRRIEIEAERDRIVAVIAIERDQLNEIVNNYLSEHLSVFQKCFYDMDEAALADDVDGYIMANVTLQRYMNHDSQFTNKDEFDSIMNSDIAFNL